MGGKGKKGGGAAATPAEVKKQIPRHELRNGKKRILGLRELHSSVRHAYETMDICA